MFIELVDSLRCIRPHEPTWLVAASQQSEGRHILRGVLGCPVCHAEYPIINGVADFGAGARLGAVQPTGPAHAAADSEESRALRAAALLDLQTPGGFVVLAGEWSAGARQLLALVDGVHILALNPSHPIPGGAGVSVILATGDIPLRRGVCRGLALDGVHGGASYVGAATEALRPGGRLVAPAGIEVPVGITELARDDTLWVGTRHVAQTGFVPLTRAR